MKQSQSGNEVFERPPWYLQIISGCLGYQTQTTGSNLALGIITANDRSRFLRECTRLIAVDLFGGGTVALLRVVSGAVAHNPLPCMAEARFYGTLPG